MSWSLKGVIVKNPKIDRVIDGDTIRFWIPVCCKEYIFNCRLNGINTPEIRTKNKETKQKGLLAKEYVEKRLKETTYIELECFDFDKYGRVLCEVYLGKDKDRISMNQELLLLHYAEVYPMKN